MTHTPFSTLWSVAMLLLISTGMLAQVGAAKEDPQCSQLTALADYVNAPDDSYAWEVRGYDYPTGCTVADMRLTSQVWQGITSAPMLHGKA